MLVDDTDGEELPFLWQVDDVEEFLSSRVGRESQSAHGSPLAILMPDKIVRHQYRSHVGPLPCLEGFHVKDSRDTQNSPLPHGTRPPRITMPSSRGSRCRAPRSRMRTSMN